MYKQLKVGVIGVGGIARTHMPGWNASEYAEVVAGSDLNESVLQRWGAEHNVKKISTCPAEIINDPDIDIIDICTPNMYHTELVVASLNAGKHVLCEKPLAPTPEDIHKMIAARDRAGKLLMTAQHFRFQSVSQAMKCEIDRGVLGDIYHARSWMLRRGCMPVRPGLIYKKNSGGGSCIDIGVHILDLTLWFMGNPKPITVTGVAKKTLASHKGAFNQWGTNVPIDIDVEDFAASFVRFDNGATLILEVSWLIHHKTEREDMQMWLYGSEGGAHWPNCEFLSTNYQTKQFTNIQIVLTEDKIEPHARECIEFSKCVIEGRPSPVPAEQSLQVMQILNGIYLSQETGREIRLSM